MNNVGAMDYPQYFLNMATDRLWQLININIGAATLVRFSTCVFAVEVLCVIRLSPCQPDHALESSTTIKVITMQILCLRRRYERCVIQLPRSYVTTSMVN